MADPLPDNLPTPVVVRTLAGLRACLAPHRAGGRPVALVPTMGAFHEGHLDLMRRAGADGHLVVVSLFVNPAQFGPGEDLTRYPRDEAGDLRAAAQAGVAVVLAPSAEEIYPRGFCTRVMVGGPSQGLEGAARPEHFAGVATVVAKLLVAVRPERALFGQKDAQQVAVVRRLMRDLHLDDLELVIAPTAREPDGLAMSSRNAYLGPEDRAAAAALRAGLVAAERLVADGEADAERIAEAARAVIAAEPRCALEYAVVVDADSFAPLARLDGSGPALLAIAARIGPVRLIDNSPLVSPVSTTIPRRVPLASHDRLEGARPLGRPALSRTMLKSKIHRATVTDADLNYVGSITVDRELLELADIHPYEQVHVVSIANGARFETYAIEGEPGSGTVCLNGAAARLAQRGDLVIVLSYAQFAEADLRGHEPIVIQVDADNRPVGLVGDTVPEDWREG